MPIANSNTGAGFSGAISYSLQEEKLQSGKITQEQAPQIMEQNKVFGTAKEMAFQMREVAAENTNVKNPVLHLRVNFNPAEKLSEAQQMAAVKEIMKGVGLDENRQYLIVKHSDKEHEHFHVIANRVDFSGDLLSNKDINRRLIAQTDRVEKEQGLQRTENRTIFFADNEKGYRFATAEEKAEMREPKTEQKDKREGVQLKREMLKGEIELTLKSGLATNATDLKNQLKEKGIEIAYQTNKNGISGVSLKYEGVAVKGSQIGYKWNDLQKELNQNKKLEEQKRMEEIRANGKKRILAERSKALSPAGKGKERAATLLKLRQQQEENENRYAKNGIMQEQEAELRRNRSHQEQTLQEQPKKKEKEIEPIKEAPKAPVYVKGRNWDDDYDRAMSDLKLTINKSGSGYNIGENEYSAAAAAEMVWQNLKDEKTYTNKEETWIAAYDKLNTRMQTLKERARQQEQALREMQRNRGQQNEKGRGL